MTTIQNIAAGAPRKLLSITAPPTFNATVPIPVAGGETLLLGCTLKHMTRNALRDFLAVEGRSDDDTMAAILEAWSLDVELNASTLRDLLNAYPAAGRAILREWVEELTQARKFAA